MNYKNDNNLLCAEDENGKKNFYQYSFLISQKQNIIDLRNKQSELNYEPSSDENGTLSASDIKNKILAQRDSELAFINELILQAETLKCN